MGRKKLDISEEERAERIRKQQAKSSAKWNKLHTRQLIIRFNIDNADDLKALGIVESKENKCGFIKKLILDSETF